jgi:hypothetical protein
MHCAPQSAFAPQKSKEGKVGALCGIDVPMILLQYRSHMIVILPNLIPYLCMYVVRRAPQPAFAPQRSKEGKQSGDRARSAELMCPACFHKYYSIDFIYCDA